MLGNALKKCDEQLNTLACCKTDETPCNCVSSLSEDYTTRADSYDCLKKMNTYVLRYGPAYMSEIYHYLVESDFKRLFVKDELTIASLGCGFSPDYYAIEEYISTYKPEAKIKYEGVDNSTYWSTARPTNVNCTYQSLDLTKPFIFNNADVVIISKVFSTLYRNNSHTEFLKNLKSSIETSLAKGSIVIFIDINNNTMGRDVFHNHVASYLPDCKQYYFDGYSGYGWQKIANNYIICEVPDGLSVHSLNGTGKTVIFEYRK
ncbi:MULTISPECIES: hypothetical protein [Aliivibrio]|uniref:Class I SAM-dependent methyltransferase n=1 Tax=Aliivibrio finisterrensis TaxID=511998 RepID=A0A4Q5KKH9_9GAMM|nr:MULTISPECIES: hypothetical protein [Aliivibrio]MDD9180717.1 hypothetical protein [Aliivibrio sp. A6]RYU46812.1 hypothetical protein ERW57_18955 [Aliivibrio finisterrensis]RYU47486.1 hypothetical protein ERW56_19160 [Aliivibrio finisterrensis]RYU52233.1 hypothetical protein ERW50_19275 [Aliivibrio finisterrensis]RYU78388.1 hypothetical protein ERW55_19265 [Aliivibrio finisterrensis]